MKITMKSKSSAISRTLTAILALCCACQVSANDVLFGPTDYAIAGFTPSSSIPGVGSVGTINSNDLNGTDSVFIEFTVANANANDGWLNLVVNGAESFGSFGAAATVGAFLTRVTTATGTTHDLYDAGTVEASGAAAAFADSDGFSHSVRITLSGFGDGNGFTGTRTVTFEVDEFSTTIVSADATLTTTLDFGSTDNGLSLHFQAAGQNRTMNVSDFTVTQVPEPGTYALIGGLLALGFVMVHRRW